MSSRKRGTSTVPEELQTTERLSTKKELAERRSGPPCPAVPMKGRRQLSKQFSGEPKMICYTVTACLSPLYKSGIAKSYYDQLFDKRGKLGEGSFGYVNKACYKEDNKLYAIKILKPAIGINYRYAEVRNNEKIGVNKYCVQYFMSWEEHGNVYLMLEYCEMSLADYSSKVNDICEDILWNVLYDICNALNYLHKNQLLHLDVKPGNIMIKNGHFKLGDFGLLVDLNLDPCLSRSTLSDGDSKYLALEVLKGIYKPACDIFGLGISLLELSADLDLPDHGLLWQQLRHQILPQTFYDRASLGFKILIERMLLPNYEERPSTDKIFKYTNVKAVEKQDLKGPRNDIVAIYFNEFDEVSSNLNNNDMDVDGLNDSAYASPSNETRLHDFKGRRALFKDPYSPGNFSMDSQGSPSFLDSTGDSLDCHPLPLSEQENSDTDLMPDDVHNGSDNDSMISSTPVVKMRRTNVQQMPRHKLFFD